jgi:hypothetical protein
MTPLSKLVALVRPPKPAARPIAHQERAAVVQLYPRRNVQAVRKVIGPTVGSAHTHQGGSGSDERT